MKIYKKIKKWINEPREETNPGNRANRILDYLIIIAFFILLVGVAYK